LYGIFSHDIIIISIGRIALKERDYDVIVYGAGPEGIAAALAAADRSARTLLADDCPDVGGSAVCGLLNCWRGEAESSLMEFVREHTKRAWNKLIFEPEEISPVLRRLLYKAGVDVLTGACLCKARMKVGRLKSLSLATRGGKVKLSAWCYIDASQDFALARQAGCCFDEEEDESSVSLLARIGGIDTRVPGVFDAEALRQYVPQFDAERAVEEIPPRLEFPSLAPCLRGGTAVLNAAPGGVRLGAGALARSDAESRCREAVHATLGFLQRNVPGYENCYLIHFATQPIYAERPQPLRRRSESSAIEVGSGALEDVSAFVYRDPDKPDTLVNVPVGNLLCRDAENLLLARTGAAVSDQMPLLLASGAAAGKAAAEAVLYDGCISKLDPERMRKAMIT
jgi:hypothetical protein